MSYVKNVEMSKLICEAAFRRDLTNVPLTYYLGLGTGVQPSSTALLSAVVEVTGPGYSRKAIAASAVGFPTLVLAGGGYKIASLQQIFAATGLWSAADYAFLTNVAAGTVGKLYGSISIPTPFVQATGEEFDPVYEYLDI